MVLMILSATFLSILFSVLFLFHEVGISMVIFVISLLAITIYLLKTKHKIKDKKYFWYLIPIVLLASTYFFFHHEFFRSFNVFVMFILYYIMIMGLFNGEVRLPFALKNILKLMVDPIDEVGEVHEEVKDIFSKKKQKRIDWKIVRAIIIPIPIVFFVIFLLSRSEALFHDFLESFTHLFQFISNINMKYFVIRIVVFIFVFYYLLLFFYYLLNRYQEDEYEEREPKKIQNALTFQILLVSLNLIYLIYSILQVNSLITYVFHQNAVEYAHYARSGFFELMIVSFINLAIILFSTKYKEKSKFMNIMNTIMVFFTFILLISSFLRMRLYEMTYGYTMLRLLVYFALITEAVMLIPTIIYVWKREFPLFKTYFIIGVVAYTFINFVNLDRIIAKENINRYFKTGKIDIYYLVNNLNIDAYSEIVRLEKEEEVFDQVRFYKNYMKEQSLSWDKSFWSINIQKEKIKKIM